MDVERDPDFRRSLRRKLMKAQRAEQADRRRRNGASDFHQGPMGRNLGVENRIESPSDAHQSSALCQSLDVLTAQPESREIARPSKAQAPHGIDGPLFQATAHNRPVSIPR